MSLYLYTQPLENSLFDVLEDDFFNSLVPCNTFGGSCHDRFRNHRNPFGTLEKQLNKIFNDEEDNSKLVEFIPKINLSEDENNYYIHADLPGMTKEQVKMEINEEGILTISGERENIYDRNEEKTQKEDKEDMEIDKTESTESNQQEELEQESEQESEQKEENQKNNDHKYNLIECNYGTFSRSFTLPENANLDGIQAKMENGVLEIIINKIEIPKNQTRSIQIQ